MGLSRWREGVDPRGAPPQLKPEAPGFCTTETQNPGALFWVTQTPDPKRQGPSSRLRKAETKTLGSALQFSVPKTETKTRGSEFQVSEKPKLKPQGPSFS